MERYFKPLKPARSSPSPTAALAQPAKRARSDSDSSAAGGSSSSSAASGSSSSTPLKVVTWNCNGLSSRLASDQDLGSFVRFVRREAPDVILLQEVRMAAAGPPGAKPGDGQPRHRGKVHVGSGKKGREDSQLLDKAFHGFAAPLADYRPYLSLADKKYAGSAALVSRKLKPLSVRYRLGVDGDDDGGGAGGGVAAAGEHDPEGRVLLLEFQHWQLLATYTPNNGVSPSSFERRQRWDAALTSFVRRAHERATACDQQGGAAGKPLIYVGDLNVAAADVDLSHPSYFRNIQMDKQAGGRGTIAPENRGQPGCTDNERRRFREMLDAGQLVDVYRRRQQQQQLGSEASASASAAAAAAGGGSFGSDGSAGCSDDDQHRYYGKGMRIDHLLLSTLLLDQATAATSAATTAAQVPWRCRVRRAEIVGYGADRHDFFGSDHCPMLLELQPCTECV